MSVSVFAADHSKIWQYRYRCTLEVSHHSGGVPNDPKIIQGWLKTRLFGKEGRDSELAALVARTAVDRGIDLDADPDAAIAATDLNVNGFKHSNGGLVFEGRCVKAAIKEYFSIALGGGHFGVKQADGSVKQPKWGATGKGMSGFIAEHVQVPDDLIPLCRPDGSRYTEPDSIEQRFVSTWRGQGISYTERLDTSVMTFTVEADWDLDKYWPIIWTIGEQNGIGAMRSQGSGKFVVTEWERLAEKRRRRVA